MIKKSIETVKRNPVILVWVLTMFFYNLVKAIISTELFRRTVTSDGVNNGAMFVSRSIGFLLGVIYVVFIFGPMIYLIYEGAVGKVQKGWYKTGVKRSFARLLPLHIIFSLLATAFINILSARILMSLQIEYMYSIILMPYIYTTLSLLIIFPYYFIIFPVMAEKKAGTGYKNIFKVWIKYFFAFVLLYTLTHVSASFFNTLINVPIMDDMMILSYIFSVIKNVVATVMMAVMYIIGMNMYVSKRAQLIEIKNKNIETKEEIYD